jgi:hypothetical protein
MHQWFVRTAPSVPVAESLYSQSLDTIYKIDVLADGQSEVVRLQKVIRDETLDRSLITRKSAEQTRGARKNAPRTAMTIINGQELSIEGTIELRWWLAGTAVTHEETFYLVDNCGGYDGIFRADIGQIDPYLEPGCATLVRDKETEGNSSLFCWVRVDLCIESYILTDYACIRQRKGNKGQETNRPGPEEDREGRQRRKNSAERPCPARK